MVLRLQRKNFFNMGLVNILLGHTHTHTSTHTCVHAHSHSCNHNLHPPNPLLLSYMCHLPLLKPHLQQPVCFIQHQHLLVRDEGGMESRCKVNTCYLLIMCNSLVTR